jgi:hypothetical protein
MKRKLWVLLLTLPISSLAQQEIDGGIDRFGVFAKIDEAYHFSDRIFIGATDQKIAVGMAFADKSGKFLITLGGGFRLFKFTYTSPGLTQTITNAVNANYIPVPQAGFDSLVGSAMSKGGYFQGSTGSWLQASFCWVNRFRPTVTLYYGTKGTPSYGPGYTKYTDPEYGDIEYAQLRNRFYELKFGFSPPFLNKRGWPFSACVDFGLRLNDYKSFSIGNVPISTYTNPEFGTDYRFKASFTIGLSFCFWSNWIWN